MELFPESALAAGQPAEVIALLPRPSLLRNLGFWLLAMLLGSLLLLLYPVVAASSPKGEASFLLCTAGMATIGSLAALLLPLLPWALTAPSVGLRWLRVFTLQSLSLGGLTALGYQLLGSGSGGFGKAAPLIGTVYFVAGLLAAALVHRRWLWQLP